MCIFDSNGTSMGYSFIGAWGYSWQFLVGARRTVLQILTLFQTKNFIFSTHFQTCSLKSIPVFRFGLYDIMSSLLRLEHQRKRFLSLLFKTETMNTFIHYRRFLETRTRFQIKMGEDYTRFKIKTAQ